MPQPSTLPARPPAATAAPARPRLTSIDWLRGLVMALMLIDHTRDFMLGETFWHRATDLTVISSGAFVTRWITHFCAPVFVFLAGLSIHLQLRAGKAPEAVRRFLWTRGLWLVFCEFTVVTVWFNLRWNPMGVPIVAQTIWALGLSMIVMSFLIRLPRRWILAVGALLVFGHNFLDGVHVARWSGPGSAGPWAQFWTVLHQGGPWMPFGGSFPRIHIAYPLIPWPGVMALGYGLGRVFDQEPERRRRTLAVLGLSCVLGFVAIRALDSFGDAAHWGHQATPFRTLLSFVNTTKYPPSLLYLLMTIGPGLLVLAWREGRADGVLGRALVTLGRVPMFFYLLQWPMAHGMGILFHAVAGKDWRAIIHQDDPLPANIGFGLGASYLAWAVGLALLFPLCRWFAGVKRRHADWWWLSYL